MAQEEKLEEAKRLYQTANADQRYVLESLFPELKESEDERISREITEFILTHRIDEPNDIEDTNTWLAWLEKQAGKDKLIQELGKYKVKYTQEILSQQLEKQGEQKLANSTKTCKDEDTLLSLLQQMPSCITVDGIDYHFVMKKTIAYMVFYEGGDESSRNVIFWMAGDPIDICKEMLKRLEKEGLT